MVLADYLVRIGCVEEAQEAARYVTNAFPNETASWAHYIKVLGHDKEHLPPAAVWRKIDSDLIRLSKKNSELLDLAAEVEDKYLLAGKNAASKQMAMRRSMSQLNKRGGDDRADLVTEAIRRQAETYKDYIGKMMQYIDSKKTNPQARYVWNMTWAFPSSSTNEEYLRFGDQMKHYEAIVAATQEHVLPISEFSAIIPSGTAVQNVRTSRIGDTLNRDNMHLNSLGYIIAGCMTYATLTGKPIENLTISQFPASTYTSNYIITDEDKQIVLDSVKAAFENPFQVTQSAYTD